MTHFIRHTFYESIDQHCYYLRLDLNISHVTLISALSKTIGSVVHEKKTNTRWLSNLNLMLRFQMLFTRLLEELEVLYLQNRKKMHACRA